MGAPIRRLDEVTAPTYGKDSPFFTVELIHGGYFHGSCSNKSYLNGAKACYDFCDSSSVCMRMFDDLIEDIGYETAGRIHLYWLLPGCQLNEDGARLLSNDEETESIARMVKNGHKFLMFYVDHKDSYNGGGGKEWGDVVANPIAHLPHVSSPKKASIDHVEKSTTDCSYVDDNNVSANSELESNEQTRVKLRPRGKKGDIEEEEDCYTDDDSSDSDYVPEIVDSDFDIEDGDEDLAQDQLRYPGDKKGKQVVEDCNSEDEKLEAPDSDSDEMKFNFKSFTTEDMHDPKFHVGQLFSSVDLLRKAIREYSVKERVNITFPKNDRTRLGGKCTEHGCPWYIYASLDNRTDSIMVKTFSGEHNCSKKWQVRAFTARYIANKYVEKIRANEKMTLKGLAALVQEDFNMTIKRGKLGRARTLAFNMIYGDEIAQYDMLWDYANELRRSNPGSTFFVELADDGQFQKCYFSFDACKRGFLSACRPVIFLDGCHLKTQFGGILLSAVGMDPNDCIFPVAHAVVQSEDTKAWRWFLTALKQDLGIRNTSPWTIMSDKQKGLIKAVRELFSDSPHRFCVRHLWQNFNKNFKGEALKNQLWKCARSSTEGQFRQSMNEMLVLNKEAHDWVEELAPPTWVRAYQNDFPKCDVLLNNNCEVFNKYILDAREMPIISMCQRIKGQIMGRIYGKQQEPIKWHGTICPKIRKKLDRNIEAARTCLASPAGKGMFVVNNRGVDFSVDTVLAKCSCKRWDLSGIPCCHGVSALRYDKISPEDRVNSCYSIETYCKAYEHIIFPCRDVSEWTQMNGRHITPPPLLKQKGRRRKNRRKQPEEKEGKKGVKISKKGAVIHCSYCGLAGHNKGGCLDYKLGLKPKKKFDRVKVRAEPDVSSSDEDEPIITQEQNLQTEQIVPHEQQHYEPEIIACLTQERVSSQREPVAHGPLPENSFIQMHAMSQQPTAPTTATNVGNVHRKREVIALAKLRVAAERREIADQAKFDAAMAKLKEEEEKLLQAAQKRKDELLAKKQAAEEKKKAILEEKRIAAEEKRKASEEKKKKAQEEKLAMAEKRRQCMAERKRNAELAKQRKAEEKKRVADEKRMIAHTPFQREEAEFLIHQAEEEERRLGWQDYAQTEEAARQQAWEQQSHSQDTQRIADWEERKRKAEEANLAKQQAMDESNEKNKAEDATKVRARAEQDNMKQWQLHPKTSKRTPSNQQMSSFKKPRKVNMFDELRGG